jgi:uncharacterized membrane protein YkoI
MNNDQEMIIMIRKPLFPLIGAVLTILLVTTGISVMAARRANEQRITNGTYLAGESEEQTESEQPDLDDSTSITSQNTSEQTTEGTTEGTTVTETAGPTETTTDVTAAATTKPSGSNDDRDDDQDEESDDDKDVAQSDPNTLLITPDAAKAIAIARIGGDAKILELDLESKDNPPIYDIELIAGGFKYEIKIHAVTGAVIDQEKATDD